MSFLYLVIELFLTLIVELWLISSFFTLSQLLIDICSSKLIQSSNELDVKKLIADRIIFTGHNCRGNEQDRVFVLHGHVF